MKTRFSICGLLVLILALLADGRANQARAEEKGQNAYRDALERNIRIHVPSRIRINNVLQVHQTSGVILRDNVIITGAVARFPTASFILPDNSPAKIIGWATEERVVAILYGRAGAGFEYPDFRLPIDGEKVACVGFEAGKEIVFETRVVGQTKRIPRGHRWVYLEHVVPDEGTAFGVYAVKDKALVGLYIGRNKDGVGSIMVSMDVMPTRLEELKPVLIKLDWSGRRFAKLGGYADDR